MDLLGTIVKLALSETMWNKYLIAEQKGADTGKNAICYWRDNNVINVRPLDYIVPLIIHAIDGYCCGKDDRLMSTQEWEDFLCSISVRRL